MYMHIENFQEGGREGERMNKQVPPPFLYSQVVQSLLSVLVEGYGCEFTQRDVQRMELIIMQKLDFKLTSYTSLDFLKIVSSPNTTPPPDRKTPNFTVA